MLYLLHADDLFLLEHLDSVEPHVVLGPDQVYPAETSCAQRSLDVEIGECVSPTELPSAQSHRLLLLLQGSL